MAENRTLLRLYGEKAALEALGPVGPVEDGPFAHLTLPCADFEVAPDFMNATDEDALLVLRFNRHNTFLFTIPRFANNRRRVTAAFRLLKDQTGLVIEDAIVFSDLDEIDDADEDILLSSVRAALLRENAVLESPFLVCPDEELSTPTVYRRAPVGTSLTDLLCDVVRVGMGEHTTIVMWRMGTGREGCEGGMFAPISYPALKGITQALMAFHAPIGASLTQKSHVNSGRMRAYEWTGRGGMTRLMPPSALERVAIAERLIAYADTVVAPVDPDLALALKAHALG